MNGRMRKAAEARTKRVLSAGMRSMNDEGIWVWEAEGLEGRRFDPLDAGAFTFDFSLVKNNKTFNLYC